jgi:signal transduction histidine kinase
MTRDRDGAIIGARGVLVDVTARRAAEELRQHSAELEARNRRIEEASRLKSEFLANMSHELRTPLNAILGFAELLHDGVVDPASPQHREFLGDILNSGQHLLQLINDVLDLAKVEAGRLELRPEPIDLSALVAEVCSILRTTAASRRITVEHQLDPALTDLVLDPSRLKQVLYNYLSNALKFTHEGGRVTIRATAEGDDRLRLEVEDDGIGIAPADLNRLFLDFQQLDGGSSKRHPGTGLGLALTRRLVEAQGGEVGVRSQPGLGSVFHAVLPRHAVAGTPRLRPRRGTAGPEHERA